MVPTAEKAFEVWGSPVEHSLSPALHQAAYRALGLPWTYRYREVSQDLMIPTAGRKEPPLVGDLSHHASQRADNGPGGPTRLDC
jgi:shikimate 5-dehydrogenase